MSWKNRLRRASFKGAVFGVESHQSEQGRRISVHEYPGRDEPYIEDLGKKARTFSVRAFCVGADYMAARDKLLEVCSQAGAGQLVHPYLGTLAVICTGLILAESAEEGGLARFDLSFVEAGRNQYPQALEDPVDALLEQSDLLDGELAEWFGSVFDTAGVPDWLSAQTVRELTGCIERFNGLAALMDVSKQQPFLQDVQNLLDALKTPVGLPADLAFRVVGMFTALSGSFPRPTAGIAALQAAFRRKPDYSAPRLNDAHLLSPALRQNRANRAAAAVLFELAALNAAAATAVLRPDDVRIEEAQPGGDFSDGAAAAKSRVAAKANPPLFESLDEALVLRRSLLQWLDSAAETAPDAVWSALQDVRAALAAAVPDAANELPRLRMYTPRRSLPVLALAYTLHGDARRSAEILRHNDAPHPGFMPAMPLRVLGD